jgi:hypothetical protein
MTVERVSAYSDKPRKPPTGLEILGYVETSLDYFVNWPNADTRRTVALWVLHSHVRNENGTMVWQSSPRLWFQSKEPGSGKSWAMKIASFMTPKRAYLTEATDALIVAAVKEHKTIFLDETDILFGRGSRHAKTKAIVNDGYTPDGSTGMVRNGQMMEIPTFGALSLAGLEALEYGTNGAMTALLTRTIRIRMKKAKGNFVAPRLDKKNRAILAGITELCQEWTSRYLDVMENHVPDMPDEIGTRLAELWEPLLTIADIVDAEIPDDDPAKGTWPEIARNACVRLSKVGTSPDDAADIADEVDDLMSDWIDTGDEIIASAPERDKTDSGSVSDPAVSAVDRLVSILADSETPLGATVAANRAGINPSTARVTLRRLVTTGTIRQTSEGTYTTP